MALVSISHATIACSNIGPSMVYNVMDSISEDLDKVDKKQMIVATTMGNNSSMSHA